MQALDALKTRLLDLAIRGHLVPQLDTEPEVEHPGDKTKEFLFDIPKKWKWTLLSSLTDDISDGSHNPPKNVGSGVPVLSAKNIIGNDIDFSSTNRWATEDQWILEDKKIHIAPGDVLLTIVGTIGRTAVVKTNKKFMLQRSVCILKPKQRLLDSTFLSFALGSPHILQWMNDRAAGTAQKGVYLKTIKNMPFPLPPLEEQKRIVEKLDSLFSKIGVIQKSMDEVSQLGASLEKQLLQSSISGKLVPQLDGESEVVQIGQAPQEAPFEIPKKWKWTSLGEIAKINPSVSLASKNTDLSFVPMKAVSPGYSSRIEDAERISFSSIKQGYSKFINGDLLLAKITPCFQNRKSVIAQGLIKSLGCGSTEFHVLRASEGVDPKFLLLFLKSDWFISYGVEHFKGTAGQQRLNATDLKKCPFPLPPLNEQKRIVEKLDKLMLEIQKLK